MKTVMKNSMDFEPVDDTPVSIPTRLRLPQSRTDQIRAFIRAELSRSAMEDGHETFEEADDFEIDEEDFPMSPYELQDFDPPAPVTEAVGEVPTGSVAGAEPPKAELPKAEVPDVK